MPTRTIDPRSEASDPGGIQVSHPKIRQFHPELYEPSGLGKLFGGLSPKQKFWQLRLNEQLMHGDSRPAVVLNVKPLIVAAYTDELDCVALLRFPDEVAIAYKLTVGMHLLSVNVYNTGKGIANDLKHGPASYRRYCNFTPIIAEFVSEDFARIEERKAQIPPLEWELALQLGQAALANPRPLIRDGRPLNCGKPGT